MLQREHKQLGGVKARAQALIHTHTPNQKYILMMQQNC